MSEDATTRWGGFDGIELLALENALSVTAKRDRDLVAMRLLPELKEFMCPSPPTPEERVTNIVRPFFRSFKGFDDVPSHIERQLTNEIAAAIRAALKEATQ